MFLVMSHSQTTVVYSSDYLLWFLNSHHYFDYVDYMGLKQPEDDNIMMLAKV